MLTPLLPLILQRNETFLPKSLCSPNKTFSAGAHSPPGSGVPRPRAAPAPALHIQAPPPSSWSGRGCGEGKRWVVTQRQRAARASCPFQTAPPAHLSFFSKLKHCLVSQTLRWLQHCHFVSFASL